MHPRQPGTYLGPRGASALTIQRTWVEGSVGYPPVKCEQWDRTVGDKRWYRRTPDTGETQYRYEVTSGSMDLKHEAKWHTRAEWTALKIEPPPDVAPPDVEDYPAATLPQSGGGGWDVRTLLGVLVQHGLRGVCNAMSAAYLADLIAPDPPRLDRRSREQLQQDHAFQATLGWGCEVLQ